ncbi:agrin-like isoform X2 [Homarus americanus]|uniref:agrin-like isoform X2 n=1 Tax=Homarus americanus TaxID=6706 RepID=UPI001C44E918|nr:agrin-like isoform X2 [Homarus americanus]
MKILLLLVVTAVLTKESLAQGVPSERYNLSDEEIIPVAAPSLVQPLTSDGLPQTTNTQSSPLPVPQEKECPEICTFEYLPVCGSNGVTYSNECSFTQAACNDPTLTLLHVGACVTSLEPLPPIPTQGGGEGGRSPCKKLCIRIFAPVCGTDGKIYSNECVLNSFSCMSQEKGGAAIRSTSTLSACESQLLDHPDVDSIVEGSVATDVGSSGPSVHAVEVPVDIVDSPPIVPSSSCPTLCPKIIIPVCGSDGVTHSNPCVLQYANCRSVEAGGSGVSLVHNAPCDDLTTALPPPTTPMTDTTDLRGASGSSTCTNNCPKQLLPICGSDGKTYRNKCELKYADCLGKQHGGGGVSKQHRGPCISGRVGNPQQEVTDRTAVVQGGTESGPVAAGEPVDPAGSIGQTPVVNAPVGTVDSPPVVAGSSCRPECTKIYLPVCGSDGVTYNNMCLLEYAGCTSLEAGGSGVTLVQNSSCEHASVPVIEIPVSTATVNSPPVTEAPIDPIAEIPVDTIAEVPVDTIAEVPVDTIAEVPVDTIAEVPVDTIAEVPVDTIAEVPVDTIAEVPVDTIAEIPVDTIAEVPVDTIAEVPVDTVAPPPVAPASSCPLLCIRIFIPVCGSDGVSYENPCLLELADCKSREAGGSGVTVVQEGPCGQSAIEEAAPITPQVIPLAKTSPCPTNCTRVLAPVCGSDGVTYSNICLLKVRDCLDQEAGGSGVQVVSASSCDPKAEEKKKRDTIKASSCRQDCKEIYDPVCGNDGKTYDNECLLDMANCRKWEAKEPGVYIVDDGICGQPEAREIDSLRPAAQQISVQSVSTPVQSLSAPVQSLPAPVQSPLLTSLGVSTRSSSTSSCSEICTLEYDPICGSDNLTYNSQCHLKSANCRKRSLGGVGVTMAFQGPCVAALPQGPVCNQLCDKSLKYVCGSDGETYNNPCLLAHANCLNPFASITVASEGRCGSPVALSDTSNSTEEESSLDEEERLEAPQGDYLPPL